MFKRFWSIFVARNKEFVRDRAGLGWNFMFPFLIILGFSLMFQRGGQVQYKFGMIPGEDSFSRTITLPEKLKSLGQKKLVKMIPFADRSIGFDKLRHHKVDILFEPDSHPIRYWINKTSPNGVISESLLLKAVADSSGLLIPAVGGKIEGDEIDYIDWLFPGIIAMNMMFSALYGVGYVIVRYRKIGVLKRLKATPLNTWEYLAAHVASRLLVIMSTGTILFIGCSWVFGFTCKGSYFDLALIYCLGGAGIISVGILVSVRTASEELINGLLTLISWPMMFLSEVWFSIEGATEWVRKFSKLLPLTYVTEGMRKVMNEGAGLSDLKTEIFVLSLMTAVLLALGSVFFKWTRDD